MITCPLCEHVQPAGDACDVCGRALEPPGGAAAAIPPVEGLEPTAAPAAGPVDAPPLAGLEPTVLDARAAARPSPEAFPELEPTRAAAAIDLPADPVPDLEPTGAASADPPTPYAAFATCRYCRTPAAPGERRCARCGMRLPLERGGREFERDGPAEPRRCTCGAPVSGAICPACGGRISDARDG